MNWDDWYEEAKWLNEFSDNDPLPFVKSFYCIAHDFGEYHWFDWIEREWKFRARDNLTYETLDEIGLLWYNLFELIFRYGFPDMKTDFVVLYD